MIRPQPDPVETLKNKKGLIDWLGLPQKGVDQINKESSVGDPLEKSWFQISGGTSHQILVSNKWKNFLQKNWFQLKQR